MRIEMNGEEIEMDETIENVNVYVDPYDGSARFISFEIWASDPTGWTEDVLASVVELRPEHALNALEMSPDLAGTCKSLGDTGGYHVR